MSDLFKKIQLAIIFIFCLIFVIFIENDGLSPIIDPATKTLTSLSTYQLFKGFVMFYAASLFIILMFKLYKKFISKDK